MTRRDIDQDKICRFVLHKQHLAEPSKATGKKLASEAATRAHGRQSIRPMVGLVAGA